MKILFRIDGTLREIASPPKQLQAGILSRIKNLASLDIAERRIPQDGRSKLRIFGRSVDIREFKKSNLTFDNHPSQNTTSSLTIKREPFDFPKTKQKKYSKKYNLKLQIKRKIQSKINYI